MVEAQGIIRLCKVAQAAQMAAQTLVGAAMAALAAATKLRRIAYVSCNPSTFARDARILVEGGWRLDRITPVGQFRWSTHVELVAAFTR